MTKAEQQVTPRQKAAIYALAAGVLADWKEAFIAAHEGRTIEAREKAKSYANVAHWKARKAIQDFYAECVDTITTARAAERLKGQEEGRRKADEENEGRREESEPTETQKKTRDEIRIDYYDPANQRRQINRIIAESSGDPKTQLDAIKAIQQTQRDDRQAAQDRRQVQAFLPLRCQNCPLYERQKAKK